MRASESVRKSYGAGLRAVSRIIALGIALTCSGLSAQEQTDSSVIAFTARQVEVGSDYERTVTGIYLLDLVDERMTRLISGDGIEIPVWTSDGQHLVFSQGGEVYLIDIESGDVTNLSERDLPRIYSVVLTDGTLIARDEAGYLLVDAINGAVAREIAFPFENYWQQSWSPEAHFTGFVSGEGYTLFDTFTGETLTLPDNITAATWSATGRYVVLLNADYDYFIVDTETGERRPLDRQPLAWLPDDSGYLLRMDGELLRYQLADSEVLPFTNLTDPVSAAAWSPDGSEIALATYPPDENGQAAIYIADANGESLRPINLDESFAAISSMAWQP